MQTIQISEATQCIAKMRERERKLYNKICFSCARYGLLSCVEKISKWMVRSYHTLFSYLSSKIYMEKKINKKNKVSSTSFFMSFSLNFLSFTSWLLVLDIWFILIFFFLSPAWSLLHWAPSQCVSLESVSMFLHFSHQKRFSFPFKIKLIFLINHQVEDAYDQWT